MKKNFRLLLLVLFINSALKAQENFKKPPYLKIGDTIAIVAPAGILKSRKGTILKAKKLAESWGLKVVLGDYLFKQNNHFAGTDAERCKDFQAALDAKNIKAIWAARGGYGSVRILDMLDFSTFKKHPKWIIGYSDITAFHNHIHNLGFESLHAMMPTSLEEDSLQIKNTISSFKKALFGEDLQYTIKKSSFVRALNLTSIEGVLVGGNLAILSSMLGSNGQLNTTDKILFIEEIGEYKYAIDRMLQSLKRANYFNNCKGVIIGDMTAIKKNSTKWGSSIEQLILEAIPEDVPVFFNFKAGHEAENNALIFGRKILIDIDKDRYIVKFTESVE
ncbi:S66 peptidase family protein [Polaribacter tangerinus]|uniref:S66 peptidase family protein n=1 Tax=Polaribacter tangerinus TaxID=1920034 RepID=UPI000B4B4137|nr:LD-carboxypeptidase [Polaribacter tangerinus]